MIKGAPARILHVLAGMNRGGVETWLMHVLRNIDQNRYQFDFLTTTKQTCAYDDELREMGCKIIPCLKPSNPLQYGRNFKRLVRESGPYDILHSHVHHFSGFVCLLGKHAGIPMRIAHSHNDTRLKETRAGFMRRMYLRNTQRMIFKYATHGVACSGLAAEDLFGGEWESDERWKLLYCAVDLLPFKAHVDKAEVRAEFGFPPDAFVLGHVGRFATQKNHSFLIDIIAEAVRKEPKCRAFLVGDGPLRPTIESKVHALGLNKHVVFAGQRADIPRLMKGAMDAFVFPSHHEGLGLVLIEAQAAGIPCFASDRVPSEAAVVNQAVKFIGLYKMAEHWADLVLSSKQDKSSITTEESLKQLMDSPFSINNSVSALCSLYDSQTNHRIGN